MPTRLPWNETQSLAMRMMVRLQEVVSLVSLPPWGTTA